MDGQASSLGDARVGQLATCVVLGGKADKLTATLTSDKQK